MSDYNHECLEVMDIIPCFVPVDMQTGANTGAWASMKMVHRMLCVLYCAVGTSGDNPVVTLQQATSNAGAGAKALNFTRYRTKIGAIASTPQWTLFTQAAANTATPTSGVGPTLIAVDVTSSALDVDNGFAYVQLSIPDTGTNAHLGCAFYLAYGLRFGQSIPLSNIG